MLCVIESHVESFVEASRKSFQRRIVAGDVCVADNAHGDRGCCELSAVTISAGFVTREARGCGVVGSLVTGVAGEGTVSLTRVKKLGVIDLPDYCGSTQNHKEDTKFAQTRSAHLMSLRFSGGRSAIR